MSEPRRKSVELPLVVAPDADAHRVAEARIAELAVPTGALGGLGGLGCRLAAVQGVCPPRPLAGPRVIAVAADHGNAAAGVSAYAGEVTLRQVQAARKATAGPFRMFATRSPCCG